MIVVVVGCLWWDVCGCDVCDCTCGCDVCDCSCGCDVCGCSCGCDVCDYSCGGMFVVVVVVGCL